MRGSLNARESGEDDGDASVGLLPAQGGSHDARVVGWHSCAQREDLLPVDVAG
jgi:hypothetical protein